MRSSHGKYILQRKVIDLGTGEIMEEVDDKDTKEFDLQQYKQKVEKGECDYDLKMDKETWQYFKAQHQSIDNRKKSI